MMNQLNISNKMNVNKLHKQLGLAALEFVLVLPSMLFIAFVVVDFARLLYQYDTLTKSTRDAARYISLQVRPTDYATNATYNAAIANAQNLALCGSITACGTNTLVKNLTTSNITIDYPATVIPGVDYVRVRIQNYNNSFITRALGAGFTKNLGAISMAMRQLQQSP